MIGQLFGHHRKEARRAASAVIDQLGLAEVADRRAGTYSGGFRIPGSTLAAFGALGLCLLYGLAFTVVFMVIGLYAPNPQAAQGMSMIAFILAFISSTYVPASTMPGWLQPFAENQPISPMVDAVRSALTGSSHDVALAVVWSVVLIAVFTPVAIIRYRHP